MSNLRSRRDYGRDEWVTREQMAEICPTCAVKMDDSGMTRVRASAVQKAMKEAGAPPEQVASITRTARQPGIGDFLMQEAADPDNTAYAVIIGDQSGGGWKVVSIYPWRGVAAVNSTKGWFPKPEMIKRTEVPTGMLRKLERKAEPYLQKAREDETSGRMSSKTAGFIDVYRKVRSRVRGAGVLLIKMGDYYEAFDDDARAVNDAIGVSLIKTQGTLHAGVPYHSLDKAVRALKRDGYKVTVVEDPSKYASSREAAIKPSTLYKLVGPDGVISDEGSAGGMRKKLKKKPRGEGWSIYQSPGKKIGDKISSDRTAAWDKLPKGWTKDSVKKMWGSLTGSAPKHKVTACIKKMDGKVDNPGAFCASLADKVTPGWRSKKSSDEEMMAPTRFSSEDISHALLGAAESLAK